MKGLNRYYRQIREHLPCSRKCKNETIQRIDCAIHFFLEQNPDSDISTIKKHFGTPQQIAISCIDEMDTGMLLNGMHVRKRITNGIMAGILVFLLLWAGAVTWAIIKEQNSSNGYYSVSITE